MNFITEEYRYEATPNFIYLDSQAENIPEQYDPANHTPEAVVRRIKESGAIAVKSYYESGFGRLSNLPVPTKRIMSELLDEAHSNGLVLACSCEFL